GTATGGNRVGEDSLGNAYFEGGKTVGGLTRRWVIYSGSNDASRVPPEWHGWLHGTLDDLPGQALPPIRPWQAEPQANQTGTRGAYRPAGALDSRGQRAGATGDYQAWTPDNA
ncbi:MAG: NADH:ubiquinone oxidoreductase subunit NDUFA12, partial [Sphingopyxis sp.]